VSKVSKESESRIDDGLEMNKKVRKVSESGSDDGLERNESEQSE
jgi:hypothetical protein